MKIFFIPLGDIDTETIEVLRKKVNGIFHCPSKMEAGFHDLSEAYNPQRKQYLSSKLIASLQSPEGAESIVGIADVDLYVPGLNFIFGEADVVSGTVIISLHRLRQEYYGLAPDEELFLERATKEIVHELGHTFGLGHCH